jgi:CheY-like chemotaxis protein
MLDILLPGADGFEILKKLKADPRYTKIPVVLLSNLSQPTDLQKGKDLGAVKFLIKSTVTLDEIIDEIKSVLAM